MTRPIKFRAWDNKAKKWLMGYELPSLGGFSLIGEMVMLGEWGNEIDKFLFSRDGYTSGDLKIMQFTGLLDKNGKEIYEGDVVENSLKILNEVVWSPLGLWGFTHKDKRGPVGTGILGEISEESRVIGNIWENQELIK